MAKKQKKRVTFYIDGFNFYYGIKRLSNSDRKWGNAYWIDLLKLCEGFISPDEEIEKVIQSFLNILKSIYHERIKYNNGIS